MVVKKAPPLPKKRYRTILADPPWRYDNKKVCGGWCKKRKAFSDGGVAAQYPTMSVEEIKALPVADIADTSAVLFLWVTTPMLPIGLEVLSVWGFEYKTSLYWHKVGYGGMGYWFLGRVEQCLLGVKGGVKAFHCKEPNIKQCGVREHSMKPAMFLRLIDSVCPKPAIELFARSRKEGWDVWGLEVDERLIVEKIRRKGFF